MLTLAAKVPDPTPSVIDVKIAIESDMHLSPEEKIREKKRWTRRQEKRDEEWQ